MSALSSSSLQDPKKLYKVDYTEDDNTDTNIDDSSPSPPNFNIKKNNNNNRNFVKNRDDETTVRSFQSQNEAKVRRGGHVDDEVESLTDDLPSVKIPNKRNELQDDEEEYLLNSIELTREEKLACVCARFKVNDPTLKKVDLANFDVFCSSNDRNNNNNSDDPTSDQAMMSIVSLLQEGARSNTLVNSISFCNSNLDDDFVTRFVDSLQDLAKSSRRRQFLQRLDLRNNEKLSDSVVFPILECLLHHPNLSLVLLEGTQVSEKNQELVREFSRLQRFPAAVKKLAWEVWTSPSYIQERSMHDNDSEKGTENSDGDDTTKLKNHSIIAPPHKQEQIPNIQFAVLFRDNNDPRAYTSEAVDAIVGLLQEAPDTLRTVRFDSDCIRGDASAERLAKYFRECPSSLRLRELNVRDNFWTSRGLSCILNGIEEQLRKLRNEQSQLLLLQHRNESRSTPAMKIINSNLTVLDIGNNDIDDAAISQLTILTDDLLHNLTRVAIDGNRKVSPAAAQNLFRACSINVEGATLRPALDKIDAEYDTMQHFVLKGGVDAQRGGMTAPMSNVGMRAIFTKMLARSKNIINSATDSSALDLANQNNIHNNINNNNNLSSSSSSPPSSSKMMPNLEEIVIPNHNFGVDAVKMLARLIHTHEKLTIVDLSQNAAVDDECVHHLVRALYANNSVIDVNISGCSVTPRLADQLAEACALNREPSPMKYYVQLRAADPTVTKLVLRKKIFGVSTPNYTFARVSKKLQLDAESFRWIREILQQQPQIVEVDLSGNENIGNDSKTFEQLVELVRMGLRFSKLNVSFTHLSNEQAQRISSALYLNHYLKHIISTGNAKLDNEGAALLQTATTMNQLPSQFKVLYRYLNNGVQGITKICFDNKNSAEPIGNEGARILLSSLNKAPHVRHLTLNFQQLTDSLAPDLERFLSYQSCLVEISLAHNSLGDNCAMALAEVIGTHRETTCTSHLYSSTATSNNKNTKNTSADRNSSVSSSAASNGDHNNNNNNINNRFRLPEEGGGLVSLDLSNNLISDQGVQEIIRGVQHHLFAPLPYTLRSINLASNNSVTDLPTAILALDLRLEWCLQPMEFQAMFARTLPLLLRNVLNQQKDFEKDEIRRMKIAEKERRKRQKREMKVAARARSRLEAQLNRIFDGKTGRRHPHDTEPTELPDDDLDDDDDDEALLNSSSSSSSSSATSASNNLLDDHQNEKITTEDDKTISTSEYDDTQNLFDNHHHNSQFLFSGGIGSSGTPQTLSLQSGGFNNNNQRKQNNKNNQNNNNTYSYENISLQSSKLDKTNQHEKTGNNNNNKNYADSSQVVKKYSGYIWNEQEMTFVGSDAVQLNDESFKVLHGLMLEQQVHFKFQPAKIQTVRFPRHRFNVTQLDGIGKLLELFSNCNVVDLSECNFLDRATEEAMIDKEKRIIMMKLVQQNPRHQLNTSFLFAIGGQSAQADELHEDEYSVKLNRHGDVMADDDGDVDEQEDAAGHRTDDERKFLRAEQVLKRKRLLLMNEIVAQTANVFSQHQQLSISQDQARKDKIKLEEETMKKLASKRREVITRDAISLLIEICIKCPHIHRIYLTTTQYAVKLSPVDNEKLRRQRKRQEKEEEEVAEFYQNEFANRSNFGGSRRILAGSGLKNSNLSFIHQSRINNKTEDECRAEFMHAFDYFYDVLIDEEFWRKQENMIRNAKKKRLFSYEKEMLKLLQNNNNNNNQNNANRDAVAANVDFQEWASSDDDGEDQDANNNKSKNVYDDVDEYDDDDEDEEEEDFLDDEEEEDEDYHNGAKDDDGASSQHSSNDDDNDDEGQTKHSGTGKKEKDGDALALLNNFLNNHTPNANASGNLSTGSAKKKKRDQNKTKSTSLTSPATESIATTITSSKVTSPTTNSLCSTSQRLQHLQEKQKNEKQKKEQLKKREEQEKLRRKKKKQRQLQRQRKAAEGDYLRVPATKDPQLHNLEVRLQAVLRANVLLPASARQVWIRAALAHWSREDKIFAAIAAEEEEERLRSKKNRDRALSLMKTPVAKYNNNNKENNNANVLDTFAADESPSMQNKKKRNSPPQKASSRRNSPEQNQNSSTLTYIKKEAPEFWRNITIGYTEEFAKRDSKSRTFQQALFKAKEQMAQQMMSCSASSTVGGIRQDPNSLITLFGGFGSANPHVGHPQNKKNNNALSSNVTSQTTIQSMVGEQMKLNSSAGIFPFTGGCHPASTSNKKNNLDGPSFLEDSIVFSLQQSEELNCSALSFLLNSICPVPFLDTEIENFVELKKKNDERIRVEKEEREKEEAAEREREKLRQEEKQNKRRERELLGIDVNLGEEDDANSKSNASRFGKNTTNSVRFSSHESPIPHQAATASTFGGASEKSMLKYFSDRLLDRYRIFRDNIKHQQEKFQQFVENEIERSKDQISNLFQQEQQNLDQRNSRKEQGHPVEATTKNENDSTATVAAAAAVVDPAHAALSLLLDEIYEQKNLQDQRDQLRDRLKHLRIQLKTCKISRTSVATRATLMSRLHIVDLTKLHPLSDACILLLTCWLRCVAPQAVHVLSLPFLQSATSRESVAILLESEEGQTIRRFTMGQDPDVLLRGGTEENNNALAATHNKKPNEKVETLEEFALMKKINQLCERNRKGLFFPGGGGSSPTPTTTAAGGVMTSPSMFANRFKSIRNYVLLAKDDEHRANSPLRQREKEQNYVPSLITYSDFINCKKNDPRSRSISPRQQQQRQHDENEANLQRQKIIEEKLKLYQERRKRQIALLRTEIGNIDRDADREQSDWTAATKLGGAFGLLGEGGSSASTSKNKKISDKRNNKGKKKLEFDDGHRQRKTAGGAFSGNDEDDTSGSEVLNIENADDDGDGQEDANQDDEKKSSKFVSRGRRFVANDVNLHRSLQEQYQVADLKSLARENKEDENFRKEENHRDRNSSSSDDESREL